ncbi:endonuclease [Shewanella colwelliana]|uniref:Endonuclease n=1 Tax=Shewanella colwelliana TaxID=23 RepID=A0ABQ4PD90_SHECO|nr:endonuclease/exonuclease/phosphatase family protein [Shewanella colwelliana]GIU45377.1 endonuclease [Shewanella colwelliana]
MSNLSESRYQLKVATLNLFNYMAPPDAYYDFVNIYTDPQWLQKQAWITQYLQKHTPDVIGFQEVFSIDALQRLVNDAGYPFFAVVDAPLVTDGFIYRSPVVALASKFPILAFKPVQPDPQLATMMGLQADFSFSRKPLMATIDMPNLGACDCYVVHFKSKRGQFDVEQGVDTLGVSTQQVGQHFAIEAAAKWSAAMVRGSEAMLLRYEIAKQRVKLSHPVILMGDFNDHLSDGVLASLVSSDTRLVSGLSQQEFNLYRLQDAYHLFERSQYCPIAVARQPTHYYLASGSVLDYILLSNEFDPHNDQCLAEVERYHTYDRHLLNPIYEQDSHSTDHAPVMITLKIRL